jgi:hypothetical protein
MMGWEMCGRWLSRVSSGHAPLAPILMKSMWRNALYARQKNQRSRYYEDIVDVNKLANYL